MNITAIEPIGFSPEQTQYFRTKLAGAGHTLTAFPDRTEDAESLIKRMQDADVVIVSNIPLKSNILSACPNLKMLAVAFTGLDHIDMDYCKSKGIQVFNAAGYATNAVAELTINLMLDLLRRTGVFNQHIRQGGTRNGFLGTELQGKTVGIVGMGAIGQRVAEILHVFHVRVLAYSRTPKPSSATSENVSLEALLQESDIISLHLPLNAETKHFIKAEQIAMMRENAILINTARGLIVDMEAVARALKEGCLGGYGCDVYEIEPPLPVNHTLFSAPNTVLLPHIAYATNEAFASRAEIVMNNVYRWLRLTDKDCLIV